MTHWQKHCLGSTASLVVSDSGSPVVHNGTLGWRNGSLFNTCRKTCQFFLYSQCESTTARAVDMRDTCKFCTKESWVVALKYWPSGNHQVSNQQRKKSPFLAGNVCPYTFFNFWRRKVSLCASGNIERVVNDPNVRQNWYISFLWRK